nr:Chain C, HISTONE H3.1 [Homo sapiens]3ZVY_D Chain D, HISTONE H3.1 [Homo sapiens]4QBQ_P Chain P, Histone H3 [Homo sapiens]5SVI_C Chain C, ALA-ARG-THR-LYS-GLN-THR-ALA-ARG [Homo sapiens]5SVI_D Chain D, ALA-ARG-THR-LYS-GLN-THR-ALA-ARG [Homo sapiens]
ARTKQTAR